MQVKELITFYVNELSNTLDVTFRLETDGEEEIRNDSILIETVSEFGYNFLKNNEDYNDEDGEDIFERYYMDDPYFIEEDEVILFLNEYYMINIQKLPPVEPF